ncbi:MAG: hypothetical protein V7720_05595 [Halioglobus sp.]
MKLSVYTVGLSCALAGGMLAAPAMCKEEKSSTAFSAEVGLGGEYDSNVTIDELDAASSQSDYSLIMDAELQMDHQFNDTTDMTITYDFSQSNYDQFSFLDRQTHLLGMDLGTDLGNLNSGLSLYYINARLDGNDFLEYYRGSPYLSGFLSKRWFARGAYVYSDKAIQQNQGRDAKSHAGELDLYYFRRGLRSYFNFGYKFKDEDAIENRYDYAANNFKVRYIQRFDAFGDVLKTEFSWRYEYRDYSSITPSIGEEREDKRHRWKVDIEYPILGKGAIAVYAGYADYDSNYPRSDYDQQVVGTRLSYSW